MAELYEDDIFPASLESIYYDGSGDPRIEWKRPKDICDDPIFIDDGATKYDIAQGELSDCWFLSAAAVLATRQELFTQIVDVKQDFRDNYTGKFHFRFWRYGNWEEIEVDDRLPTRHNKLIFCYNRSTPNEFWSALLEKAYAKVHRSYQALNNGFSQDALVDLTGGIGEFIDLNGSIDIKNTETGDLNPENISKLFKRLKKIVKKNSSFLCSAIDVKPDVEFEGTLDNGLVTGHAYSICTVLELTTGAADTAQLIKLRNPWGRREWNGAWCDGSSDWDQVSEDKKLELGLTTRDEGEFWMPFDEFVKNFDMLKMCHLTPDSVNGSSGGSLWNHANYHGMWSRGATAGGCSLNRVTYWTNPQYYVRLRDPDEDEDDKCTLVISLMQKYTRIRKTLEKQDDTEASVGIDIFKYSGNEPDELDGFQAPQSALRIQAPMRDFDYLRERTKRFALHPGTYCIIPCTYEPGVEAEFLLRLAFETSAQSGEVDSPSGPTGESFTKFDRLYEKHSGDDDVIDARELRRLLNDDVKRDHDEAFSKETCRALIKSLVGDHRGALSKSRMEDVWRQVKQYQSKFDEFDQDNSGALDIRELRRALKSIGVVMNKRTLAEVARRYCGQSSDLSLDDFVLVATKISATSDAYDNMRRRSRSGRGNKVELSLDEILQMTL